MPLIKSHGVRAYKPFEYPEAYSRYLKHMAAHWVKEEVSVNTDVEHWVLLSEAERNFIKSIFLLFTQNDVQVGSGYDTMLRIFKPTEVQMMLRNQADRENVHIDAYSFLLDTIGFDESVYSEFKNIDIMKEKLDYVESAKVKKKEEYFVDIISDMYSADYSEEEIAMVQITDEGIEREIDLRYRKDIALMLAVYSTLTEGVSLFAQFAMLLNYQRFNLLPGTCQIVSWSIRDEELHVQNNSWLFRTFIKENPDIWNDELKEHIYTAAEEIVSMEHAYIDYVFDQGETKELTKQQMYKYVEYIANRRLLLIGLKEIFPQRTNPIPWMEELLNTPEFANFFENFVTEYSKGHTKGTWEDVRASLKG